MHDEMAELHALAVRASQALLGCGGDFVGRVEPGAGVAITGEMAGALNKLLLGPTPRAQAVLEEAVNLASARKAPMTAFVAPQVAVTLGEAAAWLGLRPAGRTPLMVLEPDGPISQSDPCAVRRVDGAASAAAAGDLAAEAFALPRDAVARTWEVAWRQSAAAVAYLGEVDGRPASCLTLTAHGEAAGIWCMATAAGDRRRGAGRALLARVLEDARQAGTRRFYLFATDDGRPLYENLGFRTVADYAIWTSRVG